MTTQKVAPPPLRPGKSAGWIGTDPLKDIRPTIERLNATLGEQQEALDTAASDAFARAGEIRALQATVTLLTEQLERQRRQQFVERIVNGVLVFLLFVITVYTFIHTRAWLV